MSFCPKLNIKLINTIYIAHLGIALVFENCDKPYDIFGTSDVTEAIMWMCSGPFALHLIITLTQSHAHSHVAI